MLALKLQVVSSLAIDHSGSRVLLGSNDYTVRMYDFQGMNAHLESFRQIDPSEGHHVRSLSWSPSANRFLCVTGSAQAKIYDRDGLTMGEFMKGDTYIRDRKNTKGHITGLTCGEWQRMVHCVYGMSMTLNRKSKYKSQYLN
ncbi:WD repeat-containing protein 70 [Tanacetum coccineum]